jgi:hypothetical protein
MKMLAILTIASILRPMLAFHFPTAFTRSGRLTK